MTKQCKSYYQKINTWFLEEGTDLYNEKKYLIKEICEEFLEEPESEKNYLYLLSFFQVGVNLIDEDYRFSIRQGNIATTISGDTDRNDGFEYALTRGVHGMNVLIFENRSDCVIIEISVGVLEIIKSCRLLYQKYISTIESSVFVNAYTSIAKQFKVEEKQCL